MSKRVSNAKCQNITLNPKVKTFADTKTKLILNFNGLCDGYPESRRQRRDNDYRVPVE